jgi:hypothetical protein
VPDEHRYILVPQSVVWEAERQQALARKREARRKPRSHHGETIPNREREFIAWDGEGPQDAGYALLGNSRGDEICHPFLSTLECLDFLLACSARYPMAIHIGYGFNYDVSMMLKDLPWRALAMLKEYTVTQWKGYRIEYVPRKWFTVSKDGVRIKIFDICSFFGGAYVPALKDFRIGTESEIVLLTSQKARRAKFLYSEIDEIAQYMRLELKLMPLLAEQLREAFLDAGFDVHSWHGPGALARMALRRHGIKECMAVSPSAVRVAAMHAFAGGRFEEPRGGYIRSEIYNADKRSAYPSYVRDLPNLAKGTWRHGKEYEPGKFGIYHIQYKAKYEPLRLYPLFRRMASGEVCWPHEVTGWYHGPEAVLVASDPDAVFLESVIFDEEDGNDRPFAWIEEYFNRRQLLKKIGNVAEFTFKLIINSIYGQLAQRTGWDKKKRKAPAFHQLEWAGYITSACRAAMYKVATACGPNLISVDTDGVYSMAPIPVEPSPGLGGWELEQFSEGIFWQSGIYNLRKGDEWVKGKTRGIPKGSYTAQDLIDCLDTGRPLELSRNMFIGFGLALNGRFGELNTWDTEPHTIKFGGEGKRYHNEKFCNGALCPEDGSWHGFMPRPLRMAPGDPVASAPHRLPWLGDRHQVRDAHDDLVMFDQNHLAYDEEWLKSWFASGITS